MSQEISLVTPGGPMTLTKAAAGHLRRSLTSWEGISAALPDGVAPLLPAALADIEQRLSPVAPNILAGLMQRLWDGGVPQPEPITLGEWRRLLSPYPAAVLAAAFDQVARTHRWPDPPRVADVVRWAGDEVARLSDWRRQLQRAALRARIEGREQLEEAERRRRLADWQQQLSPDQRQTLDRVRAALASGVSAAEVVAGAMPLHPEEHLTRAESDHLRARSLQRDGERVA